MKMLACAALLFATTLTHAAPDEMSAHDADRLAELTKTLEAKALEADAQTDGAATILERSIASERAEPAGD